MNLDEKVIAVIGLGYVGLPLAVEFGKNRKVIGFDINKKRIEELEDGQDFTLEISQSISLTSLHSHSVKTMFESLLPLKEQPLNFVSLKLEESISVETTESP